MSLNLDLDYIYFCADASMLTCNIFNIYMLAHKLNPTQTLAWLPANAANVGMLECVHLICNIWPSKLPTAPELRC